MKNPAQFSVEINSYAIRTVDGFIGRVRDFYFDDEVWTVRYLVIDTSDGLPNRRVLVSPIFIVQSDWSGRVLSVSMTREQIKNSPDADVRKNLPRLDEIDYLENDGHSPYWGSRKPQVEVTTPLAKTAGERYAGPDAGGLQSQEVDADRAYVPHGEPHLRSCAAVTGYHIQASDGEIGHVKELLVDEETWSIRYLVVETSHWWNGHQVLVSPDWIEHVSWHSQTVSVNLTRKVLQDAPSYDATMALDREQEADIHEYYFAQGIKQKEQAPLTLEQRS